MNELLNALPPQDFQKFLLWGIGGLVSVVAVMWRLYVSAMEKIEANSKVQIAKIESIMNLRLEDKDEVIESQSIDLKREREEKMLFLQELKKSLDAANDVMKANVQMFRNEK